MFKNLRMIVTLALSIFIFASAAGAEELTYEIRDTKPTKDKGYVVVGHTVQDLYQDLDKIINVYFRKIDAAGKVQWETVLDKSFREINSVEQTQDGGYISIGTVNNDFNLIKLNAVGSVEWDKSFGGNGYQIGWLVKQCVDGGYIIAGDTCTVADNHNTCLIKTDAAGNIEWEKTFETNFIDIPISIIPSENMGWFLIYKNITSDTLQLVEIDSLGNVLWEGQSKTE